MNAPTPQSLPRKRVPTWVIVLMVLAGVFVVVVPMFAVLAVYGVRRYIANAKTAEARNTLGQIAKDTATAFERNQALCASATAAVPARVTAIKGAKYQSSPAEWEIDLARNAGFACLQFSLELPQYYQYSYVATPTQFTATAHGDLDGDGKVSTFIVRGNVVGGALTIDPQIEETSPEE